LNRKFRTILLIALVVILVSLGLAGCSGSVAKKGWAGVTAVDNTLIFTSMSGQIYTVDGATGNVSGTPIKFQIPVSSGGLSCIPSCGGSSSSPIAAYSSPLVNGDMVIIGGSDGRVYSYQLIDGQLGEQQQKNSSWRYPPFPSPPDGTLGSNVGSSIVGGLAVADDTVFFASVNGGVYALNATDGRLMWVSKLGKDGVSVINTINSEELETSFAKKLGSKIWAGPAVDGNTVYIGTFDKKLYALNATDGTLKWSYETKGAISATPVIANGIVYAGDYDRVFYAIDASTGALVWEYPAAGTDVGAPDNWFWVKSVVHDGLVYAPNLDGKIYVLDATNGQLKKSIDLSAGFKKAGISAEPVVIGDLIVVALTDMTKSTTKMNSTTASKIFAINTVTLTQSELTSFKESINASFFAYDGSVYIHTTLDNFYKVDPKNGSIQIISLTASTSK